MKFGLKNTTVKQIVNLFSSFSPLEEAIIFGSRAKGNYKPASDIDITLKGDKLTVRELNKISMALDDMSLPYKFDLSLYKQIDNPELIDHIERVGIVFYSQKNHKRQIISD